MLKVKVLEEADCAHCAMPLTIAFLSFHQLLCPSCTDRLVELQNSIACDQHLSALRAREERDALIQVHQAAHWDEGEVWMECPCGALVPMFLLEADGSRVACDGDCPACDCEDSDYSHHVQAPCAVCLATRANNYVQVHPLNHDGSPR